MKFFEFICTKNKGRSPVAELIAQDYLEKQGLAKAYQACSSGSHVLTKTSPPEEKVSDSDVIKRVRQGLGLCVFSKKDAEKIPPLVTSNNITSLKPYYAKANSIFEQQELNFRANAVHILKTRNGLKGTLKTTPEKTVFKKDVIAIFAMTPYNLKEIEPIYAKHAPRPLITALSAYATGDDGATLPDAFAHCEDIYKNTVSLLQKQVPLAIDAYFSALKIS